MNTWVVIFAVIFIGLAVRLCYLCTGVKHVSNLFVFRRYHISQRINGDGRKILKEKRKELEGKALNEKFPVMALVLGRELKKVVDKMEPEKNYKIFTHMLTQIKHMEKKKKLVIVKEEDGKPRLLIESIAFLGMGDFLKVLFSKDQTRLIKKFYQMTIRKTQQ